MTTSQEAREYPPLPTAIYSLVYEAPGDDFDDGWQEFVDAPGYTAEQMRSYVDSDRKARQQEAMQEAISVLETIAAQLVGMGRPQAANGVRLAVLRLEGKAACGCQPGTCESKPAPFVCRMTEEIKRGES